MAHCRRKFHDAKDSDPVPAHQALAFIRQLYAVEDKAKGLDAAGRLAMRQAESVPVLEQMHDWLLRAAEAGPAQEPHRPGHRLRPEPVAGPVPLHH